MLTIYLQGISQFHYKTPPTHILTLLLYLSTLLYLDIKNGNIMSITTYDIITEYLCMDLETNLLLLIIELYS